MVIGAQPWREIKMMENILLIPIGAVDSGILDSTAGALREVFGCEAMSGKSQPVPPETYDARRRQYASHRILKILEPLKPDRHTILLGVIDLDLYVPQLNFVFGEADPAAGVAIIALPRLRQEFYGLKPDRVIFLLRAAKEAIHELGHLQGLDHCPDPGCVMHFSNSLRDTDVKEARFCAACRESLMKPGS